MPTDPDSIPRHVVEIAQEAMMNAHLREHKPYKPDAWQAAIAAALDALFTDEALAAFDHIAPADVLDAVLIERTHNENQSHK